MRVRTWVGRFTVTDGRVEEEGQWLGSLIRQRPDEEPDELYVLVEPASAASESYTSQLVDVIAQLYSKDPLSLTGALTRSAKAAHEHLREWNRRTLKEHRVGAGASCVALRGPDAYVLQVGPSLAYVLRADGGFRRLEAEQADFEHSLGMRDAFEPRLTRVRMNPGDLVLLASTQLDDVIESDHVRRVLEQGADEALPELYLLCRDRSGCSVVLLTCFVEEDLESPPDFLKRNGASNGTSTRAGGELEAADGVLTGAPSSPAADMAHASIAMSVPGEMALPPRPAQEQVREITQTTPPPADPGVRLRGEGSTLRYRSTTRALPLPHIRVPRMFVFGALAVALIGLIAWWQLPGSVAQSREDRFTALLSDARGANARAQATADPAAKRELLGEAKAKLVDAGKIHKDSGELAALRADVTSAIAVLDAVYEVKDFRPIADLAQVVTGQLSVTRSLIGGGDAYFLDAQERRILRMPVSGGAPETIFREGEIAGVQPAPRPLQIAWSEPAQTLLIIDEKRELFAYAPSKDKDVKPSAVRGADGWGSVDGTTSSGGNLYVLDVKANQVWRYLPGASGFDSERTGLLDAVDLRDATEIAVGQDVYVLDKKGIRRFVSRGEVPFPLAGLDMPMVSPASLSVLPGSSRLVVADRGNKRIIVASADGTFLRQIVSPSFTDLRAVAVDEGKRVLYVLNGDTLMAAAFPP